MKISEKTYNAMPPELQGMFNKMPNPGSDEVLEGFPYTKSGARNGTGNPKYGGNSYYKSATLDSSNCEASEGSAARFFYCAKASRSERNAGLEGMEERRAQEYGLSTAVDGRPGRTQGQRTSAPLQNHHPTVKPLALMRYLCKLTRTPTGGVVLDPFMGSGSTGCAAVLEGRDFIGIDLDPEYVEIARRRIEHWRINGDGKPSKAKKSKKRDKKEKVESQSGQSTLFGL